MEIKQIINSKVNSFVFSKDISSGDFLKEILKLFYGSLPCQARTLSIKGLKNF